MEDDEPIEEVVPPVQIVGVTRRTSWVNFRCSNWSSLICAESSFMLGSSAPVTSSSWIVTSICFSCSFIISEAVRILEHVQSSPPALSLVRSIQCSH